MARRCLGPMSRRLLCCCPGSRASIKRMCGGWQKVSRRGSLAVPSATTRAGIDGRQPVHALSTTTHVDRRSRDKADARFMAGRCCRHVLQRPPTKGSLPRDPARERTARSGATAKRWSLRGNPRDPDVSRGSASSSDEERVRHARDRRARHFSVRVPAGGARRKSVRCAVRPSTAISRPPLEAASVVLSSTNQNSSRRVTPEYGGLARLASPEFAAPTPTRIPLQPQAVGPVRADTPRVSYPRHDDVVEVASPRGRRRRRPPCPRLTAVASSERLPPRAEDRRSSGSRIPR